MSPIQVAIQHSFHFTSASSLSSHDGSSSSAINRVFRLGSCASATFRWMSIFWYWLNSSSVRAIIWLIVSSSGTSSSSYDKKLITFEFYTFQNKTKNPLAFLWFELCVHTSSSSASCCRICFSKLCLSMFVDF